MPKDFAKLERPTEQAIPKPKQDTKNIPIWVWIIGAVLIGNLIMSIAKYNKKLDGHAEPNIQLAQERRPVTLEDVFSPDEIELGTSAVTTSQTITSAQAFDINEGTDSKVNESTEATFETTKPTYDFYQKLPEVDVLSDIQATPEVTKQEPSTVASKPPVSSSKKSTQSSSNTQKTAAASLATSSKKAESVKTKKPAANKSYLLQVASFKSDNDAKRLLNRLKKASFNTAYIQEAEVKNAVWHRVMLGEFKDYDTMNSKRQGLKLLGFDSMLITLKR